MNPWWKRPSSESSSTASREADKKRSRRSDSDDDGGSGGSRRRRGRRGGRGRSQERSNARSDNGNGGSKRRGRGGRSRGGSRRGRRGGRGRGAANTIALLIEVEALHKALKAAGREPEAVAEIFANVGDNVARRAVASSRRQKVQRALADLGFDVERVEGGKGAARLRLALDGLELALSNRGAQVHLLGDGKDGDDSSTETKILTERLTSHGAQVSFFSIDEPLALGKGAEEPSEEAGDDNAQQDEAQQDDSRESRSGGRRRRRRGRRGRAEADDSAEEASPEQPSGEDDGSEGSAAKEPAPASTSDPLALLTAAIGKLVAGESQLVWATKVRQEMSSIDPLFSETEHGYDDFEALLREAERRGRISLQKDPRTSTFVIVGYRAA